MAIDLENIFTYHKLDESQVKRCNELREAARDTAAVFIRDTGFEEKTVALNEYLRVLEQAVPESTRERENCVRIINKAYDLALENYNRQIVDLVFTASMFANSSIAINENK